MFDGLKDLATQLKFLLDSWPVSLTQHPTMQQLYERREAALEYHCKKFEQESWNRYMQYRGDYDAEDEIDCI